MRRRHLSKARRAAIHLERDGVCHICGEPVDLAEAEFDHVIPFALGGADADHNLGPVHQPCHRAKTKGDVRVIAKAKRVAKKHQGIITRRIAKIPGSKGTPWKKRIDGTVERRD